MIYYNYHLHGKEFVMFSPLQVISSYSLLQSTLKIEEYVKRGQELGYQSLALTDVNVMYGVLDFYHACEKYHIKPLIGLTLQLNGKEDAAEELILFAQNKVGYQNLMKISSAKMSVEGFEAGEGPLPLSAIQDLTDGLKVVIPAHSSIVRSLQNQNMELANAFVEKLLRLWDVQDIYLGVDPQMEDDLVYGLRQIQRHYGIQLIANVSVKYLNPDEVVNLKVLNAIGTNAKILPNQIVSSNEGNDYLKPIMQTQQEFTESGLEDCWQIACQFVDQIDVQLKFPPTQLPHYETPEGISSNDYLRQLCQVGLQKRLNNNVNVDRQLYQQRLDHELQVIHRMGFDDYFLIVWDVTNFSHTHDILVGPGRGSAAGSLVSYTLFITDVDPIKYGLLFERFLNEERAQMPDIDLDIPDQKRDEIINYVHQKYGQTHMAQIITFAHLNARQVIRDVSRVMGQNQFEIETWSKAMPRLHNLTLKDAYQQSQSLRNMIADSQTNRLIYQIATALEGLPRQYSTHAAGVILSDHDLRNLVPVQLGSEGIYLTQFAKEQVEEIGLLKIDFLGLRNLTILDNALHFVKRDYDSHFDINQISLDDPETLKLFQTADTAGIFQFESNGIRNVLRQLQPQTFEDIVSTNALFRPGPIKNIDEFIKRKNGKASINYLNSRLEPILKLTYGIIVYQEQVMQVASAMGGFSLGQADLLRRAMSKKKQIVIDQMRDQFVQGALQKGYSQKDALQVYSFIERFGNYGFNRSHSVAYSKLAFQLAYLKCHYPAAFYAAILNSVVGASGKTQDYVMEARERGVKIHLPNINQSQTYFILRKREIYFGFRSIRKLRMDFIQALLNERKKNGIFHGLVDFIQRMDNKYLSQETLSALIYAGALDSFDSDRNHLLAEMPGILEGIQLSGKSGYLLKQLMPKQTSKSKAISKAELLEKEAEYLGTYISGHPLDQYHKLIELYQTRKINQLKEGQFVQTIVYIKNVKVIRTKNQTQMSFVNVSDTTGEIDMTVFPQQFAQYGSLLHSGEVLMVSGKVQCRNGKLNLLANNIQLADRLETRCYYLRVNHLNHGFQQQILQLIQQNHGSIPVMIYERQSDRKILLDRRFWLSDSEQTRSKLVHLLGNVNVVLQ